MEEVKLHLGCDEDGVIGQLVTAPDFGGLYKGALQWLRREPFLKSGRYREQQWAASRDDAFVPLVTWEIAFVNRMKRLGVPVYARTFCISKAAHQAAYPSGMVAFGSSPHHYGYAVDMVHSVLGSDLPPFCWQIFRHVGEELAEQLGLRVCWGGESEPEHWEMLDWKEWALNPPPAQDWDVLPRLYRTPPSR